MTHRGMIALLGLGLLQAGCGPNILAIEVLPPRTGVSCAAPAVSAPAAARGLLDLNASEEKNGAYVGDLRVTVRGGDLRIDGFKLSYELPSSAGSDSEKAAENAAGEQTVGDLLLTMESDEVDAAVLENIVLLPRELAVALRDDDDIDGSITKSDTVVVNIEPVYTLPPHLPVAPSTFAIDVCRGCLTDKPEDDDCPDGVAQTGACRYGQDQAAWDCATPSSGGLFP